MSVDRLRRRLAFEAAKLIFAREESQYGKAKLRAAQQLVAGQVSRDDMPCSREIRRCVLAISRRSRAEQAQLLVEAGADRALGRPTGAIEDAVDRFRTYELLLAPLETVMQSPEEHPEGDALYHSLQVFEVARLELPYDEEFLLAALLHDVGKAIDRRDHVAAGLAALDGIVSDRTAWLIEHHVDAMMLRRGTLGARLRRRLEGDETFEELMLLADCDFRGRAVGVSVPDVPEALAYVRELADECGEA